MQTMRSAFHHEIAPHYGKTMTLHARPTAVRIAVARSKASDKSDSVRATTIRINVQRPDGVQEAWPLSSQKDMDALMAACKCKGGTLTTLEPPVTTVGSFMHLEDGRSYKAAPPMGAMPIELSNIIIGERTSDGRVLPKVVFSVFGQKELDRVCQLTNAPGLCLPDSAITLTRINQLESNNTYVLAKIDVNSKVISLITDIKNHHENDIYSLEFVGQAFVNARAREVCPGHPVHPFSGTFKYDNTDVYGVEIDAAAVVDDVLLLIEAKRFASSALVAEAAYKLSKLKVAMGYNAELRSILAPVKVCHTMLLSEGLAKDAPLQDVVRTAEAANVGLVLPNGSSLACVVEAKQLQFP